ncbi:MAG: dihydrolipoamide acetyltransferase family protein [Pseudomonadota bacterium]
MAIDVVMPALGLTVEKGVIVKWLKKEGEAVSKGESLFEIEADKVATEVESPATGILARILVPVGVEVPILTVVAVITEPGEELPTDYSVPSSYAAPPEAAGGPETEKEIVAAALSPAAQAGPVRVVPAARRLAKEKGIDLEAIAGSGPEGIILLRDVESASRPEAKEPVKSTPLARKMAEVEGIPLEGIKGSGAQGRVMRADVDRAVKAAAAPQLGKVIPMTTMRRVIARRMAESAFQAPHIYFFTDVWMEPLLNLRQDILSDFEKKFGLRPSVNDFLIKATALNLLDFPILNAMIKGEEIHILSEINVCLAVALPDGLIVPAIANADTAGLGEIARQRQDLVQRALAGKLTRDELERGTFTISSLAQYDVNCFTAILNPPQSGILSVGKTREELALVEGAVRVKKVATFGLAVDHRIIDGAVAAEFLQNLKRKLEQPLFTFLDV